MIYAYFKSILVPKDNGNKIQKSLRQTNIKRYIACSYGNKLVCVDDKFSKRFKTDLGKDAIYNFINSITG